MGPWSPTPPIKWKVTGAVTQDLPFSSTDACLLLSRSHFCRVAGRSRVARGAVTCGLERSCESSSQSPRPGRRGIAIGSFSSREHREIQSQAVPDWSMRCVISLRQRLGGPNPNSLQQLLMSTDGCAGRRGSQYSATDTVHRRWSTVGCLHPQHPLAKGTINVDSSFFISKKKF